MLIIYTGELLGSALASDCFFVSLFYRCPGQGRDCGNSAASDSNKDAEVIEACNKYGIAMAFKGGI